MRRHGERVYLTVEEAVALLPEQPHTFRGRLPMVIGADCTVERATEMIAAASVVELSGPVTTNMGHGLTLWWHEDGRVVDGLCMSTDEAKLKALELPEEVAK